MKTCPFCAVLLLAIAIGCGGGSSPTAPTTPTTPSAPATTTRTVTGVSATVPGSTTVVDNVVQLNVGESVTFTARASYNDGTEEEVDATWSSVDPLIMTMTSSGTATGVSPGTTDFTLRFSNVTGTGQITVVQPTFALTGRVTNAVLSRSVSGATVMILDGPHAGMQTTTDPSGRYELAGLSGNLNFSITKDGYDGQRHGAGPNQTTVDVALQPNRVDTWTRTSYRSGTYDVGEQPGNLLPGRYTIRVGLTDSHCYWERRRNNSADLFERVIRNGNVSQGETFELEIRPSDRHFHSDGCSGRLIR